MSHDGQLTPHGPPTRQGNDPTEASPSAGRTHMDSATTSLEVHATMVHTQSPTIASPTTTNLTFITINAQKAGAQSPSLSDIVTMLDDHSPDILLLTETPICTRS